MVWPFKQDKGLGRSAVKKGPLSGAVLSLSVLVEQESRWQDPRMCSPRSTASRQAIGVEKHRQDDDMASAVAQHDQMLLLLQQQVDELQSNFSGFQEDWSRAGRLMASLSQHLEATNNEDLVDCDARGAGPADTGDKAQATSAPAAAAPGQGLQKILQDLAKQLSSRDVFKNKDDCASMRSYCTYVSLGSTQASAPIILDDMPPPGKGTAAAAAAAAARHWGGAESSNVVPQWQEGLHAGMPSWGEAGAQLPEEVTEEEVQQLLEDLLSRKGDAEGAAVRQRAVCLLALHAERDEDVRAFICEQEPALEQLMCMLQDAEQGPTCQAAAHLAWYISRSEELREVLGQPPVMAALIALLRAQDPACARAAAFALNNLAHESHCRQQVASQGAVPALIDMMSCSDAVGQEAAAAALMMLCSEEPNIRAAVVAHNGVKALASVLQYGGPAAQEAAACALENLSLDCACEASLGQDGALEGLVSLLQDGSLGAQAAAASTLRNLAVNVELQMQMLSVGALHHLLQTVSRCEEAGTKQAVVEALRNIATGGSEVRAVLVAEGALPVLVSVARSMSGTARAAALGALLAVSTEEAHKKALINAGAVGLLVHAALSGAPLAREYAARCLTNLATCDPHRLELLREGAATVLVALLKSCSSSSRGKAIGLGGLTGSCCCVAARAMQNLAKCRPGRRQLQEAGAIPALIPLLLSNPTTAASAISTLAALCNTPRAVAEFQRADGPRHLKALIASSAREGLSRRTQHQVQRLLRRANAAGNPGGLSLPS